MYVSPAARRRLWLSVPAVLLLLPGWGAVLAPVPHRDVMSAMRRADSVAGVARPAEGGGEWHASYVDSPLAETFAAAGLRGATLRLVPPDFAAYVPAGARMAREYYAVRASIRWPWWWPGGGVIWEAPE